ncbi:MAG TPA: hypothetical protein VGG92_12845 [Caulobacteraceae bacterium]|jgi:hypothetical protein
MIADAYAILGVSPESEDVVVRAAYRALMQKYTSLTRLDAPDDDERAREIQAAYDWVAAARRAAAAVRPFPKLVVVEPDPPPSPLLARPPPAFAPAAMADVVTPPVANDETESKPGAATRLPGRSAAWIAALGALALCGSVAATFWTPSHLGTGAQRPPVAARLKVKLLQRARPAMSLAKPLPCFVDGRPVGDLRLGDCAARNGVASGSIESSAAPAAPITPSLALPPPAAPKPLAPPAAPAPMNPTVHVPSAVVAVRSAAIAHAPSAPAPARAVALAHAVRPSPAAHHPEPVKLAVRAPKPIAAPPRARPQKSVELAQGARRVEDKPRRESPPVWREAAAATRRILAAALKGGPERSELGDQVAAATPPPAPRPVPAKHVHEPASAPPARLEVARASSPTPAEPAATAVVPRVGPRESLAVTREFYQALAEGDGDRAVSLVVPEARDQGPLSAERIWRFSSGVRAPIRLTSIRAIDDRTVFVRYQYVSPSNRLCDGTADVATAPRGGQTMISGVHATYDCHGG